MWSVPVGTWEECVSAVLSVLWISSRCWWLMALFRSESRLLNSNCGNIYSYSVYQFLLYVFWNCCFVSPYTAVWRITLVFTVMLVRSISAVNRVKVQPCSCVKYITLDNKWLCTVFCYFCVFILLIKNFYCKIVCRITLASASNILCLLHLSVHQEAMFHDHLYHPGLCSSAQGVNSTVQVCSETLTQRHNALAMGSDCGSALQR